MNTHGDGQIFDLVQKTKKNTILIPPSRDIIKRFAPPIANNYI